MNVFACVNDSIQPLTRGQYLQRIVVLQVSGPSSGLIDQLDTVLILKGWIGMTGGSFSHYRDATVAADRLTLIKA